MAKEEPEGVFNLVGDPDDPELEEEILSEDDELVDVAGKKFSKDEVELAHEALEKVRLVGEKVSQVVTPFNVVIASIFMAFLIFTTFAVVFWVIPRDAVSVDTVYMQSGPGHVVLVELHNYGTKPITEVTVTVSFTNTDGDILNSTNFLRSEIPAHTSIAGDDLELVIGGATVWAQYNITIELEYSYYGGEDLTESWTHNVGDWTSEYFSDKAERHWL
ncbi:MAG: hypothetical protein QF885_08380 [Candidatus Thalassarchaeaceae archaeon]|jgi:hypothetical protein|nr:hypothetical protein [Candidatus Thalassarchaeaceae archaeon]MDP6379650.1 hypothetical protein [Candidatus Thalassarchaeaceae archaeon]MDP7312678.1 hypothetical protein [Candidatus Thalassarchaeaceae archaeon]